MTKLFNEKELAEFCGCSVGLVRRWRASGSGPRFLRLNGGRLVRYPHDSVLEFFERSAAPLAVHAPAADRPRWRG